MPRVFTSRLQRQHLYFQHFILRELIILNYYAALRAMGAILLSGQIRCQKVDGGRGAQRIPVGLSAFCSRNVIE